MYFFSLIMCFQNLLCNFNKLFQSEGSNLHCLSQELVSLYKSLQSCYKTSTYIRSQRLAAIDPKSTAHMLPLNGMYLHGIYIVRFSLKARNSCSEYQGCKSNTILVPSITQLFLLNPDALSKPDLDNV